MTQKHLLILHNGSSAQGADPLAKRYTQLGLTVTIAWASNNQFPDDLGRFAGCVLTGSGHGAYEPIDWIEKEHQAIQDLAAENVPMLGICFGSQILASALCGRDQLFRRPTCEVGFLQLPITAEGRSDPLTQQLGEEVGMLVWHNDEVRADHADMVILASSDECTNQIWRHRHLPVWGIQGHPELTRETAVRLIDEEKAIFLQDGADILKLKAAAHDALDAKTLLDRFGQIVLDRSFR